MSSAASPPRLHRHVDAVVEARGELAGRAEAGGPFCARLPMAPSSLRRFTSRRKITNGSTDAPGTSFVVVAYSTARRLPLPLLSSSPGRLQHQRRAEHVHLEAFERRGSSAPRPMSARCSPMARWPSSRCSPKRELLAAKP
jgi:hypothetical protein